MTDALSLAASTAQMVPAAYAEKAMASIMQLHSELMDEKERRVDLFRRLMEREQALAEMKMYVKMLEERVETAAPKPAVAPEPETQAPAPAPRLHPQVSSRPPVPPRVGPPQPGEGWKVW